MPDLGKSLLAVTLDCPIGSRFAYSNLGTGLLGHALVNAAGAKNYEDLLARRLATPFGMKDTTITLTPAQHARFPRCHNTKGKETPPWEFGCLEGFGAIRSTVKDMLRFTEANLDRQSMTLGPAFGLSHDKWREIGDQDPYVEYIGFRWTHAKTAKAERHMIWHNGATYGSCSFLGFMPKSGVGLVILSNSGHDLDALGFQLLEKLGKER